MTHVTDHIAQATSYFHRWHLLSQDYLITLPWDTSDSQDYVTAEFHLQAKDKLTTPLQGTQFPSTGYKKDSTGFLFESQSLFHFALINLLFFA